MNNVVQFPPRNQGEHAITSVDNALRILMLLADQPTVRVIEVADHLGVARSTAHRILSALGSRGFVVQDSRKLYHRGPSFDLIAQHQSAPTDFRTTMHRHLQALAESVGETVHLGVLEGNGARFIDGVPGDRPLRIGLRTGMLLPAHCTSIGRALLAELPTETLRALYPRGLDGVSARPTTARIEFERQIASVRRRGYARNEGESDSRVVAIGACVRDSAGIAVGAIAVAIPRVRFDQSMLPDLVTEISKTVHAVAS